MVHKGGVGKHQAELLEKYLSCSLLPWGPGRHPGLRDASWGLVLSASRMQPVSGIPSSSWLETEAPFCCRLCLTGPCPGWHLGKQQAGREREKRRTINAFCSPLLPLHWCILPCCKEHHSSSCPFLHGAEPTAMQTSPNPSTVGFLEQSCAGPGHQ